MEPRRDQEGNEEEKEEVKADEVMTTSPHNMNHGTSPPSPENLNNSAEAAAAAGVGGGARTSLMSAADAVRLDKEEMGTHGKGNARLEEPDQGQVVKRSSSLKKKSEDILQRNSSTTTASETETVDEENNTSALAFEIPASARNSSMGNRKSKSTTGGVPISPSIQYSDLTRSSVAATNDSDRLEEEENEENEAKSTLEEPDQGHLVKRSSSLKKSEGVQQTDRNTTNSSEADEEHNTAALAVEIPASAHNSSMGNRKSKSTTGGVPISPSIQQSDLMRSPVPANAPPATEENNTVRNSSASASSSSQLGHLLSPQTLQAREQHKLNRNSRTEDTTDSNNASPPPTTATTSDRSHHETRDHLAAVQVARDDFASKQQQQNLQTSGNMTAVAQSMSDDTAKRRSQRPAYGGSVTSAVSSSAVSTATMSTTNGGGSDTTASAVAPNNIPVGAFRVGRDTDGQYTVAEPSAEVEQFQSSPTQIHQETSLVIESILVEDDGDVEQQRGRSGTGTHGNDKQQQDPNTEEEEDIPNISSQQETNQLTLLSDDNVITVTASTVTFNESIGTLLKSRKGLCGILMLILAVGALTVLGVTDWSSKQSTNTDDENPSNNNNNNGVGQDDPSTATTTTTTPAPTMILPVETNPPSGAPTRSQFTLDDLSNETLQAIESSSTGTPQARAWTWLQKDQRFRAQRNESAAISQELQDAQRYALVVLFYSTMGSGWRQQSFWLDHETSACDWYPHVTGNTWPFNEGPKVCNEQGAYTDIKLNGNLLVGTLPPELSLLTELIRIDVTNNPSLTGTIPDTLCDMERLQIKLSCGNSAGLTCGEGCDCICQ